MSDPGGALAEVARQRGAAAAKVRLPWSYPALFAVVWAALLGGTTAARDHERLGIPLFPYTFVAATALAVLLVVFRRRSGLHLLWRSTPYPALKRLQARTTGVVAGGAVVELGLYLLGDRWIAASWAALVFAALHGVLVAAQLRRVNREIRADIREGRPGSA
ncbi:hypothetical protein GCM10012287_34880 [Streptomyces daqingensis]|uniref:Integral membrane protein n=1 Tax=Streptomyces daqingensis TaxID=1472640 RepID=A0ABQ2MHA8_9ACTN|nr:hypothetical protein [Streptomyces daqingensis]GGO51867.1 hypothetical protein GCM10012287_34880 [Streptomyces daqingensis]